MPRQSRLRFHLPHGRALRGGRGEIGDSKRPHGSIALIRFQGAEPDGVLMVIGKDEICGGGRMRPALIDVGSRPGKWLRERSVPENLLGM